MRYNALGFARRVLFWRARSCFHVFPHLSKPTRDARVLLIWDPATWHLVPEGGTWLRPPGIE